MRNHIRVLAGAAVLALMVASLPAMAQTQTPDLSGTWVFNADKSVLPDMGGRRMGGGDMVIKVEGENIIITSTRQGREGPTESTTTYIPDGKPHTVSAGRGSMEVVTSWKEGKLVIVQARETQRGTFTTTATYSLQEDGTLLMEREMPGMGGGQSMTMKMVYDRKK
jgi:hypothetical protein